MLSLNNKYFIGSVYAGMLWSLGDVTEPFHVNFFNVQKKNLYRLDYFYAGGSGTKHECRGQERDQIRYISAGAGGRGTEKSIPRKSLLCMQQLVSPEVLLCDIISCHMIFLQNINKTAP